MHDFCVSFSLATFFYIKYFVDFRGMFMRLSIPMHTQSIKHFTPYKRRNESRMAQMKGPVNQSSAATKWKTQLWIKRPAMSSYGTVRAVTLCTPSVLPSALQWAVLVISNLLAWAVSCCFFVIFHRDRGTDEGAGRGDNQLRSAAK
jgi:hypothetical protein